MASTDNASTYAYQRASTMATRSLVTASKPAEIPSTSSNDYDAQTKPALQRQATSHYEHAAAKATKAGQIPATTASSVAASVTDRPGVERQHSWKRSDLKGRMQGQLLSGVASTHGYSSTPK